MSLLNYLDEVDTLDDVDIDDDVDRELEVDKLKSSKIDFVSIETLSKINYEDFIKFRRVVKMSIPYF